MVLGRLGPGRRGAPLRDPRHRGECKQRGAVEGVRALLSAQVQIPPWLVLGLATQLLSLAASSAPGERQHPLTGAWTTHTPERLGATLETQGLKA